MPSGLANKEKQRIRQLYAEGKVGRAELLESESASYHGAGTCTFYGTANSNQMMMDMMGLHMPGASFINPGTKLRQAVTRAAVHRLTEIGARRQRLPAARPVRRREGDRERRRRPAGDRRLDQPRDPSAGHRARRRHRDRLGGYRPALERRAADRPGLPERRRRREPLPRRGRHELRHGRAARCRPAARRHPDGGGPVAARPCPRPEARRRRTRLRGCGAGEPGRHDAPPARGARSSRTAACGW